MQKFRSFGKWILTGEHSVLRGGSALVFPLNSLYMDLFYKEGPESLEVECRDLQLHKAFSQILKKASAFIGEDFRGLRGKFILESHIPVGVGLGASATLCVSLVRWCVEQGLVEEKRKYELARYLENTFHGQSSGVDIIAVFNSRPLEFQTPDKKKFLKSVWTPHFYLSYCGQKGSTATCVGKVQNFFKKKTNQAQAVDLDMQISVEEAKRSLLKPGDVGGLVESLNRARSCFQRWDLISPSLAGHMDHLSHLGARACKPTGSGGGGFVLSLWDRPPQGLLQEGGIQSLEGVRFLSI